MWWSQLQDWLADEARLGLAALYPPACRLCGEAEQLGGTCAEHGLGEGEARARCGLCCRPLARGIAGVGLWPAPPWEPASVGTRRRSWRRCGDCRRAAPGFGRLLGLGDYPGALRPWVLALKARARPDLVELLAGQLAARLAGAGWVGTATEPLLLVPVPCHGLRVLERGFDQVRLLGQALAPRVGGRLAPWLVRVRATSRQGEPGSGSRRANVAGVFALAGGLRGRRARRHLARPGARVVLLDDVCGSGATLGECARVLRRAGARSPGAVVLGVGRSAGSGQAGA